MTPQTWLSAEQLTDQVGDLTAVPVLLRLLAQGVPVSTAEVGRALELDDRQAAALLTGIPAAQHDDEGNLLGLGLTLVPHPTPHRFTVDGAQLYTWCASDALIFPPLLGRQAWIESRCPATQTPITVHVYPDRIGEVAPAATVVSSLSAQRVSDLRADLCNHGHFFASPAAAQYWQQQHPAGVVRTVTEDFTAGRELAHKLGWLT